jgi:hypothetical protein
MLFLKNLHKNISSVKITYSFKDQNPNIPIF